MTACIDISSLKKQYGEFTLNIDNLSIEQGKITGLVGKNGAGKTTLLESILGIRKQDSGIISLFSETTGKGKFGVRDNIGLSTEDTGLHDCLTAKDINLIFRSIYKTWVRHFSGKCLRI